MSADPSRPVARQIAWEALARHQRDVTRTTLRERFARDPRRFERHSLEGAGLFLDYSKHHLDDRTLPLLVALARASGVEERRDAMFAGSRINVTEDRAVLHVALRDRAGMARIFAGRDIAADSREVRRRTYAFAAKVRAGAWLGYSGCPITDIVNIGIGGSDLGPRMACDALSAFAHPHLRMHFVANVDGAELSDVLRRVRPPTTLFIVASKTFTTIETMTNARSARAWFLSSGAGAGAVNRHFVAVSTNAQEVTAFGIDSVNMFGFWDWVGGRFSLWSAIGLPVMLSVGPERFDALLDGAHVMDRHFASAPLEQNMPVLLALIGVWYRNFFGTASHAVLPYSAHLHRLPAYLQQLEMESNGKGVALNGAPAGQPTCPVIWGEPGTNGQHAFYQLLHQGTDLIPVDFIVPLAATHALHEHQRMLLANCFAQSSALMGGRQADDVRTELLHQGISAPDIEDQVPHRTFPGNRPSSTLLLPRLDAPALGALIALYEHKVLVQGTLWGINSFDQWGVELGKRVAQDVEAALCGAAPLQRFDPSTAGLLRRAMAQMETP